MLKLLKKDIKYQWTEECDKAFQTIKHDILQEPYLQMPNFNKQFILTTDGSFQGIGGCLSQRYDEGLRPVAYFSRSLKASEHNYGAFDIELMGVIDSIKHFSVYLVGKPFLILTDCKSLVQNERPLRKGLRNGYKSCLVLHLTPGIFLRVKT